jgi:hypothetical protein
MSGGPPLHPAGMFLFRQGHHNELAVSRPFTPRGVSDERTSEYLSPIRRAAGVRLSYRVGPREHWLSTAIIM